MAMAPDGKFYAGRAALVAAIAQSGDFPGCFPGGQRKPRASSLTGFKPAQARR
jgi:hypothetical protein